MCERLTSGFTTILLTARRWRASGDCAGLPLESVRLVELGQELRPQACELVLDRFTVLLGLGSADVWPGVSAKSWA
jgi:hypothetical protein